MRRREWATGWLQWGIARLLLLVLALGPTAVAFAHGGDPTLIHACVTQSP